MYPKGTGAKVIPGAMGCQVNEGLTTGVGVITWFWSNSPNCEGGNVEKRSCRTGLKDGDGASSGNPAMTVGMEVGLGPPTTIGEGFVDG